MLNDGGVVDAVGVDTVVLDGDGVAVTTTVVVDGDVVVVAEVVVDESAVTGALDDDSGTLDVGTIVDDVVDEDELDGVLSGDDVVVEAASSRRPSADMVPAATTTADPSRAAISVAIAIAVRRPTGELP